MKIENLNDKWEVAPDTRLTKELETSQMDKRTAESSFEDDERATKRTKSDKDSNDDHDNEDNLLPFSKSGENLSNDESEILTNSGNLVMTQVHRSIQETNVIVHNKFNSLVESQVASKKKSKVAEYFEDMRNRNIFILCEPFRKLSEADADGQFEMITRDTAVKTDIPNDIKACLCDLLSGDIESTLSKVEKPLGKDVRPLLLWTREVCRHFIFYYRYGGFQIKGSEKTWSSQTIYRIFDLFSMFFNELVSGVSFGEIVNEAHKDRIYNINADQKPSSTHRGDRNDAVICQDENATILYEQSFGPTEFDETHYLGDMTKLARNGVDDINYQFLQYRKSSITTAKKLKSIGIHGYSRCVSLIFSIELLFFVRLT
ncbi:hypothetical protein RirG_252160 [Rhizophagus irregularis DAOM 197198w]|uniref:Uncharacterized protein n=1 Tax=Rhizophagus irregularis (strain DAOM 197198w) TaxID=1432141 RepID=A0A015JZC4_RHIIW|nr:hypothetical protein RirG_252160 [Rhizophagus irregularis DAOM 197198w]